MFDDPKLIQKLDSLERRYEELNAYLADPEIISNKTEFIKFSREHGSLTDLIQANQQRKQLCQEVEEAEGMLRGGDAEMQELAREELARLQPELLAKEQEIKVLLLPQDPNDKKNVVLEIRAGTGGDEAALFAGNLFRMYSRLAERKGWKLDVLSTSEGTAGGYKEIISLIEGKEVFSNLKYESGVHRVQRVPATETQGRVHTSAATVVALPEADEVEVNIDPSDLRIDVMRASGPGGQSVNTTDSAVRIVHIPTGLIVICMDEKSQHKNKAKAMKVLSTRLLDIELKKREEEDRDARRVHVKSGDRSDKVRTYNFPQDRMTDHRISLTRRNLDAILDGDLEDVLSALRAHYQTEALKAASAGQ